MNIPRILIIESEPIIAMDIAVTLEKNGFPEISMAYTMEDGCEKLSKGGADVILFDDSLKRNKHKSSSIEKTAKKNRIPMIILTTQPKPSDAKNKDLLEKMKYIQKPFNAMDIPPIVADVLEPRKCSIN